MTYDFKIFSWNICTIQYLKGSAATAGSDGSGVAEMVNVKNTNNNTPNREFSDKLKHMQIKLKNRVLPWKVKHLLSIVLVIQINKRFKQFGSRTTENSLAVCGML